MSNSKSQASTEVQQSNEVEALQVKPKLHKTDVSGSFFYCDYGFENLSIEKTETGTLLFRCNSPEDLVTFEMSKRDAIDLAISIIQNCH